MRHILLQKALIFKKQKDITPDKAYHYDSNLGAWIDKDKSKALVNSQDFKTQSTKKLDVETGEDNKGQ